MSDRFFINFESGEINFATKWFAEKGFTEKQITWAAYHELSHFGDLAVDSKGIMGNFDYIRQKAKETAQLLEKKYTEKFGKSFYYRSNMIISICKS